MFVSRMAILKPMAMFVSLLAQVLLGCGQWDCCCSVLAENTRVIVNVSIN
jgi:hypothetical protein